MDKIAQEKTLTEMAILCHAACSNKQTIVLNGATKSTLACKQNILLKNNFIFKIIPNRRFHEIESGPIEQEIWDFARNPVMMLLI